MHFSDCVHRVVLNGALEAYAPSLPGDVDGAWRASGLGVLKIILRSLLLALQEVALVPVVLHLFSDFMVCVWMLSVCFKGA